MGVRYIPSRSINGIGYFGGYYEYVDDGSYDVEQEVCVTYGFTLDDYTNTDEINEALETSIRTAIKNVFGNHIVNDKVVVNVGDYNYVDRKTGINSTDTIIDIYFTNEMTVMWDRDNEEYVAKDNIDINKINNVVRPIIDKIIANTKYTIIREIEYDDSIDNDLECMYQNASMEDYEAYLDYIEEH